MPWPDACRQDVLTEGHKLLTYILHPTTQRSLKTLNASPRVDWISVPMEGLSYSVQEHMACCKELETLPR